MALKPILSSGVALVSAAAIVAAAPAIMPTPPPVEVAHAVPTPAKISNAKYELTALSVFGALNALLEGYDGDDSAGDAQDEGVGLGVESLLYYLLDEGLASVGLDTEYDDVFFTGGDGALLFKIADDLGLLPVAAGITDPVGALLGPLGVALLSDPIGSIAVLTGLEDVFVAITDPVGTLLGPEGVALLSDPIGTLLGPDATKLLTDPVGALAGTPLEPLAAALTDPIGTLAALLGVAVPGGQAITAAAPESTALFKAAEVTLTVEEGTAAAITSVEETPKPKLENPFANFKIAPVLKPGKIAAAAQEVSSNLTKAVQDVNESVTDAVSDIKDAAADRQAKIDAKRAERKAAIAEKKAEKKAKKKAEREAANTTNTGSSAPAPTSGPEKTGLAGGGETE